MAASAGILLVGATGYLGSLVAAALLAETSDRLVTPLRGAHTRESVLALVRDELVAEGIADDVDLARIVTVPLPAPGAFSELDDAVRTYGVTQIVHCAGSVDYYNVERLQEANIDLTRDLLELARRHAMSRFVFLSTAFSSGYIDGPVVERLHGEGGADPTEYVRSKREAEALVAAGGVPYLIVRPSIVIGDSRDGRYTGKPYGLYQFYSAFERFLSDRYREALHFIAPVVPLQLLHQDAFKNAFVAACRLLPDGSIVNVTSRLDGLPTVRDISQLWCDTVVLPREVHYYARLDDVPAAVLDRRMRTWLEFTAINSEISTHPWRFENTALDRLRAAEVPFADATLDTLRVCQDRFVARSKRMQAFIERYAPSFATHPIVFETGSPLPIVAT